MIISFNYRRMVSKQYSILQCDIIYFFDILFSQHVEEFADTLVSDMTWMPLCGLFPLLRRIDPAEGPTH